jgi:phosphonate transport system substrate-binding protein
MTYGGIPIEGSDSVRMLSREELFTMVLPFQGELTYDEFLNNASLFVGMLSEASGLMVEVVVPAGDWVYGQNAAIEGMKSGEVDLALLSWPAYYVAYEATGAQPGLNIVRFGSHFYRSQILTHNESGIEDIAELTGSLLCWVDPGSVSGYIVPSWMLLAESIDPDANAFYSGSHTQVVWDLLDHSCDAGAAFVDVRTSGSAGFPPDIMDLVFPIAVSPEIPNDTFAFRGGFDEETRTQLIDAFLSVASTPEGSDLLALMAGTTEGLVETDFDLYQGLYDLIYAAGLTPQEIWAP